MSLDKNNEQFWKQKLMAFLHDPPCKAFDIGLHEKIAEGFRNEAGISLEDYKNFNGVTDCTAASADRFPFPQKKCSSKFTGGEDFPFKHPFCNSQLKFKTPEKTSEFAEEKFKDAIGVISPSESFFNKFFLYWRRWPEQSAILDPRLAFLPADTRIPDHTIWTHMSLTSGLQGCVQHNKLKPAFLIFQMGAVQDFIAQARSTRDLWSGSYMFSWLMCHAIQSITMKYGPDSIIYPSLRGIGIFDALNKDVFETIRLKNGNNPESSLWDRMKNEEGDNFSKRLLTPALPNRFFAVIPAEDADVIAKNAEIAVKNELLKISGDVWIWIEKQAYDSGKTEHTKNLPIWKDKWDKQIAAFSQNITWQVLKWNTDDISHAIEIFKNLPSGNALSLNLEALYNLACKKNPDEEKDPSYHTADKQTLTNIGFAWSSFYAQTEYWLAARRNLKDFSQTFRCSGQHVQNLSIAPGVQKDSLSGRDDIIGDKDFWEYLSEKHSDIFKAKSHRYGAINIIKRLWCRSDVSNYLADSLGITGEELRKTLRYESLQDIACNNDEGASKNRKDEEGNSIISPM